MANKCSSYQRLRITRLRITRHSIIKISRCLPIFKQSDDLANTTVMAVLLLILKMSATLKAVDRWTQIAEWSPMSNAISLMTPRPIDQLRPAPTGTRSLNECLPLISVWIIDTHDSSSFSTECARFSPQLCELTTNVVILRSFWRLSDSTKTPGIQLPVKLLACLALLTVRKISSNDRELSSKTT